MNSKWSYLLCGVNITFAFVGAMAGAFPLMAIGAVFTVWNWYVGESRRKMEELELLKAYGVEVTSGIIEFKKNNEDKENGEDSEEN